MRISHLEKALASTHDLEAQYQSFLQEVAKIEPAGTTFDGVGPGWGGLPPSPTLKGSFPASDADLIPSDGADEPLARMGASGSAMPALYEKAPASAAGDAAPADGAFAAEDEEVARVQLLAAAAGGDSSGGADGRHDSPSPVIIWRHAAPVKIATHVPPDLLTDTESAERTRSRRQALQAQQQSFGVAAVTSGGGVRGAAELPGRMVNPAKAAYNRRMAYGVWYLPKEQWQSRALEASGEGLQGEGSKAAGAEGGKAEGAAKAKGKASGGAAADAAGAEPDGQSLAETIPKLYSSRIYKDFLKAQKVPNNRIPSYLQRVDSPKQSQSLSPRRGNIPMIDKEASGAAGDE